MRANVLKTMAVLIVALTLAGVAFAQTPAPATPFASSVLEHSMNRS